MARRIVLLSDGTGNAASRVWRTNVWRVFESLDLTSSEQVAIYDDGVGTSSFKPLAVLGGAFGWGLKRNVLDLYKFVCRNYRSDDDEIFAFGFSRGAFTIRVVMGLICSQGLVRYETEAELYKKAKDAYRAFRRENFHTIWRIEFIFRTLRDLFVPGRYDKAENIPVNRIRFLGLWDTVAAYGLPIDEMTRGVSQWLWPLELPERRLGEEVQRACHALALDDERTTFHPVLWNERGEKPAPADADGIRHTKDERISQVWFAGVHSNVGGGYPDDSLAHIPLNWIMSEAQACGLVYKTPPAADPDALTHVKGARDRDGRLYDPRKGLGSYYRYGPRKISDLCHMRFSRRPDDEVEIAIPKIHESALRRIREGAHTYAPIGFPPAYEVVTEDGKILSQHSYETSQRAQARAKAQERVWNIVWLRRVVYFATVAATLHLLLYPLGRALPQSYEYSTPLRPVSDLIRLIGSFLPGALEVWINAYAADPGKFLISAGIVAFLTWWGSVRLTGKITDTMRTIWKSDVASDDSSIVHRLIFGLRTSRPYQFVLSSFKWTILPAFFAVAFLYLGLTFASHLAFNFADAAGLFCSNTPVPQTRQLPQRGDQITLTFGTRDICAATSVIAEEGARYLITVKQIPPWSDDGVNATLRGFYLVDLGWTQGIKMALLWPLKRAYLRPRFKVIARFGTTGTDEDFLDPSPTEPDDVHAEVIRARKTGELFFYVNDAVLAIPAVADFFYRDNIGQAEVTIQRR